MARAGTYHQDYIARIRYSNVLPPPPNPPKLLDIPGTGLSGGQYTSAGYASRLAREQELNIEADGELGMPIDLVGVPGVFDGDESAIRGLDNPPPPHPNDKPLLRPLSMLGKATNMQSGVSFLRRTEYISSDAGRAKVDTTPFRTKQTLKKRKASEVERDDDPVRMLRGIYKGFDTAYPSDAYRGPDSKEHIRGDTVHPEDAAAWEHPRHPTNPDLVPLDSYPILPDLDAFPDSGNFFVIKFTTNPVAASDTYDKRLDVALLKPQDPSPSVQAQHEALMQAHAADPSQPSPKPIEFKYNFFIPEKQDASDAVKVALGTTNSRRHDDSLYEAENAEGRKFIRFQQQRLYETYNQSYNNEDVWGESVAVALHDATGDGTDDGARRPLQKAAYLYPIVQRVIIRPKRKPNYGTLPTQMEEDEKIDFLDVNIRDPVEDEADKRRGHGQLMESDTLQNSHEDDMQNGIDEETEAQPLHAAV